MKLENSVIGPGRPVFIIAEAGVNHNGDVSLAHRLVDAAKAVGADAVKFQCFSTDELIRMDAPKAQYQLETTGALGSQYDMLKQLELKPQEHAEVRLHCHEAAITYLCTPYDFQSVDLLEGIGVPGYKVASTDTTNIPLLSYISSKGRPIVLSTGFSELAEVEKAVSVLKDGGTNEIALLHCVAEYPAPLEELNLRAICTLETAFACPVGFSDHTMGILAAPWAVAAGACIIEKHFTVDNTFPGPDHRASLNPTGFRELVANIRLLEKALGNGVKAISKSEARNKPIMQRSIVARVTVLEGQVLKATDLTCKRPATGLRPLWLDRIIGRRTRRTITAGDSLHLSDVEWCDNDFD